MVLRKLLFIIQCMAALSRSHGKLSELNHASLFLLFLDFNIFCLFNSQNISSDFFIDLSNLNNCFINKWKTIRFVFFFWFMFYRFYRRLNCRNVLRVDFLYFKIVSYRLWNSAYFPIIDFVVLQIKMFQINLESAASVILVVTL